MNFISKLKQGGTVSTTALAMMAAGVGSASAQISITAADVALTQSFDSLSQNLSTWTSNSTLPGVYAGGTGQITPAYRDGSIAKTSYGVGGDRALGMSLMDNVNSDTVWYGFRYVNDTGVTLHSVEITYFVERYFGWKDEAYRFDEGFRVYTAVNPAITGRPEGPEWSRRESLEYHPPSGPVPDSAGTIFEFSQYYYFDGNHADYRTERNAVLGIAGGLAHGEEYWIMFGNSVSEVVSGETNSDGIAIDDLSVTFSTTAIPEPASAAALLAAGALACAALRRRAHRSV